MKDLKTIQEENRRAILGESTTAYYSFDHLKDELVFKHFGKPLTLDRVLRVLKDRFENDYHKMIFQDDKFFFICAEEPVCQFYWDLTKSTLEEQSEETQRTINELLSNKL